MQGSDEEEEGYDEIAINLLEELKSSVSKLEENLKREESQTLMTAF